MFARSRKVAVPVLASRVSPVVLPAEAVMPSNPVLVLMGWYSQEPWKNPRTPARHLSLAVPPAETVPSKPVQLMMQFPRDS